MTRVRERRGNAGSCFLFSFEEVLLREAPNYPLSFRGATTVASPESIVSHDAGRNGFRVRSFTRAPE
jgi:hypothetical protein